MAGVVGWWWVETEDPPVISHEPKFDSSEECDMHFPEVKSSHSHNHQLFASGVCPCPRPRRRLRSNDNHDDTSSATSTICMMHRAPLLRRRHGQRISTNSLPMDAPPPVNEEISPHRPTPEPQPHLHRHTRSVSLITSHLSPHSSDTSLFPAGPAVGPPLFESLSLCLRIALSLPMARNRRAPRLTRSFAAVFHLLVTPLHL